MLFGNINMPMIKFAVELSIFHKHQAKKIAAN
jgi:hypothetical protein